MKRSWWNFKRKRKGAAWLAGLIWAENAMGESFIIPGPDLAFTTEFRGADYYRFLGMKAYYDYRDGLILQNYSPTATPLKLIEDPGEWVHHKNGGFILTAANLGARYDTRTTENV